ncbi:hypothetical protein [Flavilitoribacter nigricans]|uniref:Uncharacterized protein n=1 Tax=Flavilitoribacter nigricans (strain ATCC 23147 / DSM 23189 / NBRC 102662 / NCIMB 1420 / SS-2) TaxID=1122177 RepID=A0A2D0N964_FLAN2|nr:hypothetical protein [Flavilitoribacter nigricans]PHN05054.1 hypothetical protein CRP01_18695 [Flavilitoribacter nigricans DSM 23189 = NBRC 102662]
MKNYHSFLAISVMLMMACGVRSPLTSNSENYTHCDVRNNFCVQYPKATFPPPSEGQDKEDLILGLYSEEYDIRLLVSADKNAESLTFEQLYEQQLTLWEETYDDIDIDASNITEGGYEVSASGEDYSLYAKSSRYVASGDVITLRLVAGPEVSANFFTDLKSQILLYPNK